MALQHWQPPGWGMPLPTGRLGQGGARERLRRQAVIGLSLAGLGFFAGLTATGRGWLAIGLAWLLVALLGAHRSDGRLLRALGEYAVVALLAVLLAGAFGPHPQPAHRPNPKTVSAAGELCPAVVRGVAGGVCDRLEALRQWAKRRADQQQPSATTTPRRR
jgi:hypothetical protein